MLVTRVENRLYGPIDMFCFVQTNAFSELGLTSTENVEVVKVAN